MNRSEKMIPRNGHTAIVGIVCRISGCQKQTELSLDDQTDHGKEVAHEYFDGRIEFRVVSTVNKGERLDRRELKQIEKMLRSRELDLLIAEDLGRIVRGAEAARLMGIGVDHGTRVISPNDFLDTDEDSWEKDALEACAEHVGHNAHTSRRLKHKLMNRFKKFGGATPLPIYGYIKPPGAKTYAEWVRDDSAHDKIIKAGRLLRKTLNCSLVAEWLNKEKVPTGPYCRGDEWDGYKVRRYFRNPLLKGQPGRGFRRTKKHHETGRRISVANPKGPVFVAFPHLAHFDPVDFDDLQAALAAENARFSRVRNGIDVRLEVPRCRTHFPGQHARCCYCGRHYVWGGNGMSGNLMCAGSRRWRCWNSIGFDGQLATQLIMNEICNRLDQLDTISDEFARLVRSAMADPDGRGADTLQQVMREEEVLSREQRNLAEGIAKFGALPSFQAKVEELQRRLSALDIRKRRLEHSTQRKLEVPLNVTELQQQLRRDLSRLAVSSQEVGQLLNQLVPGFHVFLVRLCDGGHLFPRAKIRIDLSGSFEDAHLVPGLSSLVSFDLMLDLFERPPQRERIRMQAVSLNDGRSQDEIARALNEAASQTAVTYALALQRTMDILGLTDPFQTVASPPHDYTKLRRHKNGKYRFEPLEGYEPPTF